MTDRLNIRDAEERAHWAIDPPHGGKDHPRYKLGQDVLALLIAYREAVEALRGVRAYAHPASAERTAVEAVLAKAREVLGEQPKPRDGRDCPCGDGTRPGHPSGWCGQREEPRHPHLDLNIREAEESLRRLFKERAATVPAVLAWEVLEAKDAAYREAVEALEKYVACQDWVMQPWENYEAGKAVIAKAHAALQDPSPGGRRPTLSTDGVTGVDPESPAALRLDVLALRGGPMSEPLGREVRERMRYRIECLEATADSSYIFEATDNFYNPALAYSAVRNNAHAAREAMDLRALLDSHERLAEALVALTNKIELLDKDKNLLAVFQVAAIHGQPYAGPTWTKELEVAHKAIRELFEEKP